MPIKYKYLATSLAAFYTICSPLTVQADESGSTSAALISQIRSGQKSNWNENVELVYDYLFALKEEGKSPKERIEALLAMYEPDPINKGRFKHGPIVAQHWLEILKDFHVSDIESMNLLHRALSTFIDSTPQNISSHDAEWLLNLAREVSKVETRESEALKTKASTIWHLALMAQKDRDFGRQLAVLALEQMAEYWDVAGNDAIFRVLYSYVGEQPRPRSKDDGDLLFRDVIACAKIVKHSKNKYDFQHLDTIFNELCRRCTTAQVLEAQKNLVEVGYLVKIDEKPMHMILLQLSCAYMNVGLLDEAESVITKQIKTRIPMDNLILSQCLLKQKKFAEAEKIAQQVAKTQFSLDVKFPSLYVATAKAIQAEAQIEQKKYESALPLLLAADNWFSNSIAQQNEEIRQFPFVEPILPNDISGLSNLGLVYEKLGRKADAEKTKQALSKTKLERERNALLVEKDALINTALLDSGDTRTTIKYAQRLIEICPAVEKKPEKRADLVLSYAESLIKYGKPKSAEVCLNALAGSEFSPANSDQSVSKRLLADRILLAEEENDLASAKALMKNLLTETKGKSFADDLRICEVDARLALLSGDYTLAESKSRPLEAALDASSPASPGQMQESPRDKFVKERTEAILDRVQALNHMQKYTQAARLARLVLLNPYQLINRTGSDSAANLAFAYTQEGHKGLGEAFEQEAAFKDLSSLPLAPSRYMCDAKEKLAILSEARNNLIRAKRYRAEVKAMLTQLQAQDAKGF